MFWYAAASLTPAFLLGLGCLFGGVWAWAGLFSLTVLVFVMDRRVSRLAPHSGSGRVLCLILAALHFGLLALGVRALGADVHLDTVEKLVLFAGLGLFFGQISNSNAHELIHASPRLLRRAGVAIYVSLLNGHHVSSHLLVHHVHVATDRDPNSARHGEGFWAFALRALHREFAAGWRAETARRTRARPRPALPPHPCAIYAAGAALALMAAWGLAGWGGVAAHLALSCYALLQLLLSDYVQHYGLRRRTGQDGRPEPVGPQHSWNAPKWYSSAMMLNAPHHSDHHLCPRRAFPALRIEPGQMPILPYSLPVMAVLALFPPVWRRLMDRRADRWRNPA